MSNISSIYLGNPDGEDEALENPEFDKFFFNYNKIIEKSLRPLKYLILGKKGTGKTLLCEYLNKSLNEKKDSYCELVAFNEFRIHMLRQLKIEDTPANEFIPIWKYVILIELTKVVLKNEDIEGHKEFKILKSFIDSNYENLILTTNADEDVKKLQNLSVNSEWLPPLSDEENNKVSVGYLSFIPILENLLLSLVKFTNATFQNGIYTQLATDIANVNIFIFESENGSTRDDFEVRNFSQRVDDFFGDTVAEIFVLWIGTHIHKG